MEAQVAAWAARLKGQQQTQQHGIDREDEEGSGDVASRGPSDALGSGRRAVRRQLRALDEAGVSCCACCDTKASVPVGRDHVYLCVCM